MTQNKHHKIKKRYQSPLIVEVGIDNYITLLEQSQPIGDPGTPGISSSSAYDEVEKVFPDSPTTDDPFGGSSPNYR
jgi:hypothetical protein